MKDDKKPFAVKTCSSHKELGNLVALLIRYNKIWVVISVHAKILPNSNLPVNVSVRNTKGVEKSTP